MHYYCHFKRIKYSIHTCQAVFQAEVSDTVNFYIFVKRHTTFLSDPFVLGEILFHNRTELLPFTLTCARIREFLFRFGFGTFTIVYHLIRCNVNVSPRGEIHNFFSDTRITISLDRTNQKVELNQNTTAFTRQ